MSASNFFAVLAENTRVGRNVERRATRGAERGAVMTEYVVVLALVSVPMAVALVAVGRALVATHDVIQRLCGLPFP